MSKKAAASKTVGQGETIQVPVLNFRSGVHALPWRPLFNMADMLPTLDILQ